MHPLLTRLSLLPLEDRLTPSGLPPVITAPIATSSLTRLSAAANGTAGNGESYSPSFSAGGRYVVFGSDATNLVAGDTKGFRDLFRKDLVTGTIARVSVAADGTEGNNNSLFYSISPSGRYVVFASDASNLLGAGADTNGVRDIFRKDMATGAIILVSTDADGKQGNNDSYLNSGTSSERFVVFRSTASNLVPNDDNGVGDIFRKDLTTGAIVRVSVTGGGAESNGNSGDPRMSADARYVTFESDATNLVTGDSNAESDVFRKDLTTGAIVRVSTSAAGAQATGGPSLGAEISADGRYVSFESDATNLVTGDTKGLTDIFRKDLLTGAVVRVSTSSAGAEATGGPSQGARMSADGRFISFASTSTDLVTGDTNAVQDVFRKDLTSGVIVRVSVTPAGLQANGTSGSAYLSSDGQVIAFRSTATDLLPGNSAGIFQVYATGGVGSAAVSVAENTTAVITVVAADPEGDTLTYSLVPGDDSAKFAINPTTGVLTFLAAPNFEAPTDGNGDNMYEVTVQVSDGTLTDDQDILVTVTNVAEAPVITSGAAFGVAENTTAVTTVTATDQDAGTTLTFSISGGADAARFAVHPTTGVLSFLAAPNFEVPTDSNADNLYAVTVRVSDGALTDARAVSVTVTNVNETPVVTSGSAFSTPENTTAVTTVTATDPDAGTTLTFGITGGADAALFAIHPTTGVLMFLSAPNFEAPADANGDNVYAVTVQVSDGGLTATRAVAVTVANVNEAPVITSGATAASVAENTTAVATYTATDPDAGTALTFSISGGADAARFAINPTTGVLTFVTAPNFEAPADSNADNVYAVTVRVSDGTLTDTRAVAVTVTNVNETPVITSGSAFSTPENTTAVTTVTATDPDAGTVLTYSISGGADAAFFSVSASTGVLMFLSAPNFEAPADANGDNVYAVTVQVSDGGLTATRAVAVTVANVNEAPVIGGVTAANVAENTTAVATYTATDPDAGTALTFSISGGADAARFAINPTTGVLTFVTAPNFEAPADSNADNVYAVTVRVSDGTLTDTRAVAVTVTNVNETPVIGGGTVLNVDVDENTTAVTTLTATDQDAGTTLTFSISGGADAARFAINPTTGVLTFVTAPDFEAPTDSNADNVYVVTVQVSDGTLTATRTVNVTVLPVPTLPFSDPFNPTPNGNLAAYWVPSGGAFSVATGAAVGTAVSANVAVVRAISAADVVVSGVVQGQVGVPLAAVQLVARYQPAAGGTYYLGMLNAYNNTSAGTFYLAEIWKVVGGVPTPLNTNAVPIVPATAAGQTMRFEVLGGSLRLYLNDVLKSFAQDTSIAAPGSVGVRAGKGAGVDDFAADARPVTAAALPFADAFNAANPQGSLPTTWQERSGFFAVTAATPRAVGGSASLPNLATLNGVTAADVVVSGVVQGQVGVPLAAVQLVARYQPAAGGTYYLGMLNAYNNTSAGTFYLAEIWKVVGGVPTPLNTNAVPIVPATAAGQTMRFEVLGGSLRLYLNDVLKSFAQDTSIAAPGSVGVRAGKGAGVDDFAADARPVTAAALPFADAFNAANPQGSLPTTWQERSGFFAVTAAAPRAVGGSASLPNLATLNGVSAANVTVAADLFFATAGQTAELVGRYSGTGDRNYYAATLTPLANGDALLRLLKNVNGAVTELGRKTLSGFFAGGFGTPVTGFQFQLLGTQLSVRIGATTHLTATDATFAAGSVGLRTSQGVGVDDFTATP